MRLLLDTHVLLWWLADRKFARDAYNVVADSANDVAVSSASAWEIAIKKALGKLTAPDDLEGQVTSNGFTALPVSISHGLAAGSLPRHHDDPFDRMLIAQGRVDGRRIVTRDPRFADYDVPILLA